MGARTRGPEAGSNRPQCLANGRTVVEMGLRCLLPARAAPMALRITNKKRPPRKRSEVR